MWQYAVGILSVGISVAFMANSYTLREELKQEAQNTQVQQQARSISTQQTKDSHASANERDNIKVTYAGRKTKIRSDARGHYHVTARMNGRKVKVLVDTGATAVAINKSTARRLGLRLKQSDFKYEVSTANGKVRAAQAYIERIEIGRVYANDVRAAILPDSSLNETLLGMSFLNQMKSFQISNGELVLSQ